MRWDVIIPLILLALLFVEQVVWWNRIIANDLPIKTRRTDG